MEKTYIGADLGGTKLLLGEMTRDGRVLRTRRYPTGPLTQQEAMELIGAALEEFLKERVPGYAPCAIGLGIVGRVDSRTGTWFEIYPGNGSLLEAGQLLEARLHLPVFLDNDVRSATKAELLFGRGKAHMIYLNVGTGIAAGFVSAGRIIRGGHCNAGEVGHTASGLDFKVPCACGRPDCVEAVASGSGIDRSARILAEQYPETALRIPGEGRVSAAEVFRLSDQDPLCARLTDQAASGIANLIMNLIRFNDPERIVLGGGVVADGFLYRRILEKLNPETIRFIPEDIVLSDLDPNLMGLYGACSNAIIGMEEQA